MRLDLKLKYVRPLTVMLVLLMLLLTYGGSVKAANSHGCSVVNGVLQCTDTCDGSCGENGGSGGSGDVDTSGGDDGGGSSGDDGDGNNPGSSNAPDDFEIDGEPWCYPSGSPSGQDGAGGLSIPGGGLGSTCTWSCGGATLIFGYDEGSGDWSTVGGGANENIPGGFDPPSTPGGLPSCGEWDTSSLNLSGKSRVEYICWNELSFTGNQGGGYAIRCGGNYSVTAQSSMPCPSMIRDPYPRGLVNTPMMFNIAGGGTSSSSQSREWCEPHIRNYTISVGWDQLPITPIWTFDERPWSDQPGTAKGWTVFHTYDTSSFAKRENGPSLEGTFDLPAYQVRVTTYWIPWVADSWEQWHELSFDCSNVRDSAGVIIGQEGSECGQKAACAGAAIGDTGCGEWRTHGSGKILIDMTWFGFPQPYLTRTSARDSTQPPPNIPAVPDELRQCNIPVPIIESQGLLTVP